MKQTESGAHSAPPPPAKKKKYRDVPGRQGEEGDLLFVLIHDVQFNPERWRRWSVHVSG